MEDQLMEYKKTYEEYKRELDTELARTAESFVRIGYLLKVARDTDILAESGYDSVADFARAEYGLDKTQVSRFIHINDKFAEGGYADHLMPEYQGYGYAKLTLMMALPDAINEELRPSYTKAEIQSIKDEVDEEKKVTDIERMLEGEKDEPLIEQVIKQIGHDRPDLHQQISDQIEADKCTDGTISELMAPAGEATYSVRVQGKGRIMLMISEDSIKMVNIRTGEKEDTDWDEIGYWWSEIAGNKEAWECLYGETFPEKQEVAPVQQKKPDKPSRVVKAKPEEKKKPEKEEKKEPSKELEQRTLYELEPDIPIPEPVEPETEELQEKPKEEPQEENLPGQQDMENDYPETAPEAVNIECEVDPEEIRQAAVQKIKMKAIQEILLERADSMIGHIRGSEWKDALMDIKQLKECIERIWRDNE